MYKGSITLHVACGSSFDGLVKVFGLSFGVPRKPPHKKQRQLYKRRRNSTVLDP